MAIRQLCACMCVMFKAVAFAADPATAPPPPDGPNPAAPSQDPFDPADEPIPDPGASERIRRAQASCYNTATQVPTTCVRQFIRAIFTGRSVMDYPITKDCCSQLACVRESSCADVLRGVCLPPKRDQCPPPEQQPAQAAMART
ncbi:unnamed protein product [Alopecurus aequalis]